MGLGVIVAEINIFNKVKNSYDVKIIEN